jgi:hypothetical protein
MARTVILGTSKSNNISSDSNASRASSSAASGHNGSDECSNSNNNNNTNSASTKSMPSTTTASATASQSVILGDIGVAQATMGNIMTQQRGNGRYGSEDYNIHDGGRKEQSGFRVGFHQHWHQHHNHNPCPTMPNGQPRLLIGDTTSFHSFSKLAASTSAAVSATSASSIQSFRELSAAATATSPAVAATTIRHTRQYQNNDDDTSFMVPAQKKIKKEFHDDCFDYSTDNEIVNYFGGDADSNVDATTAETSHLKSDYPPEEQAVAGKKDIAPDVGVQQRAEDGLGFVGAGNDVNNDDEEEEEEEEEEDEDSVDQILLEEYTPHGKLAFCCQNCRWVAFCFSCLWPLPLG